MRCKHWREKIGPYLDHELPPEEAAALEEHLNTCPRCAAAAQEVQSVTFAVSHLSQAKAPEGLAAAVIGTVRAAAAFSCEQVLPELHGLADGELQPASRRAVEAHVALCPTCTARLDGIKAMKQAVHLSLTPVHPPRRLARAILAATTRAGEARALRPVFPSRQLAYALVGTAAAAALVALLLYFPRTEKISPTALVKGVGGARAQTAEVPAPALVSPNPALATTGETPGSGEEAPVAGAPSETAASTSPGGSAEGAPIPTREGGGSTGAIRTRGVGRASGRAPSGARASAYGPGEGASASPARAAGVTSPRYERPPDAVLAVTAGADFEPLPLGEGVSPVSSERRETRRAKNSPTQWNAPVLIRVAF